MQRKLTYYIYLGAAIAMLSACNANRLEPVYTVGEAINAITLSAGVSDGGGNVATKAVDGNHAGNASGGAHTNFTSGTKLTLRMDGTWAGKGLDNDLVSKPTTATIGSATGNDNKHNAVVFSTSNPVEQLYWDDYGTADPDNTAGRAAGITIYGVAVDGVTTAPAISTSWTSLDWNVGSEDAGVVSQTSGWSEKDLLTSNNVKSGNDGTYKFDDYVHDLKNDPDVASNLLEFTHAMTKITVNLTAGEGFPGFETDAANAKFQTAPTVTLLGFYYTGTVDVETKTSSATTSNTAKISMHLADGGADSNKATFDALVFPGNTFSATIADDVNKTPTSSTDILELKADGNIYKVTAAQLVKAMNAAGATGTVNGTLAQAKNYILNIKVNKTRVDVTATIGNWEDVNTEEAAPKINVTSTYGYTVTDGGTGVQAFTNKYDLFRSTNKDTGYDENNDPSDGINPAARFISSAWDKNIYWPDHQTHYFFRGVYPATGTTVSGTSVLPSTEAVTTTSGGDDVIAVANAAYTAGTYPSDVAIAIPRKADGSGFDETCKDAGHAAHEGICATEGVIKMNFEYAMSKVEVKLKSSATDGGNIALTKENTKIEIVGGYSNARIRLYDGLHDAYADADKGDYALSNQSSPATGFLVTSLDAIVPQIIGNDVIFRITVITNDKGNADPSDDETDIYECKVNKINIKNSTTPVAEWVHGKHYVYELDINKTKIEMIATITDWDTVEAADNVWF